MTAGLVLALVDCDYSDAAGRCREVAVLAISVLDREGVMFIGPHNRCWNHSVVPISDGAYLGEGSVIQVSGVRP